MNVTLPCLSIRQPWAWAILNAGKDVENRSWTTRYRGPLLIHAAKGCTKAEYEDAAEFIELVTDGLAAPALGELPRGGIVGACDLYGVFGKNDRGVGHWKQPDAFGLRLGGVERLKFRAYPGALGLFRVELTANEVIDLRLAGLLPKAEKAVKRG